MANCLSAMLCGSQLVRDIVEDCDNPIFSGINPTGVIINFDDIASVVRDAQNPHIIRSIVLATGKRGYKFVQERNNSFTGTNTAANVNDFRNDFTATVAGFIPLDGAEPARDIITPMANGRYVVIVNNQWLHKDSGGNIDNEWQVYGIDKGLRMSSLQQTRYENNDAWMIELQEPNIPRSATFLIPTGECSNYRSSAVSATGYTANDDGTIDVTITVTESGDVYAFDNAQPVAEEVEGDYHVEATIDGKVCTLYYTIEDNDLVVDSFTVCEAGDTCSVVNGYLTPAA